MNIKVDKNKCIGCGMCMTIAPEAFELGKDGKAQVKFMPTGQEPEAKIKEAVDSCPVNAIELTG